MEPEWNLRSLGVGYPVFIHDSVATYVPVGFGLLGTPDSVSDL